MIEPEQKAGSQNSDRLSSDCRHHAQLQNARFSAAC
jgi:hypothetical protein